MCSLKSASSNHLESWAVRCSGGSVESLKEVLYKFEITNMIGSGYVYIVLYILRPTVRWCPMSPNFLTRQVSRYPGLPPMLVSINPFHLPCLGIFTFTRHLPLDFTHVS